MGGAEVVTTGLDIPEGPVVLDDSRIAFVEQRRGAITVFGTGGTETIAQAPGAWNACTLGADGSFYAAQNGGQVGDYYRAERQAPPGIERVRPDGTVETVATEVAGIPLKAPNDLVFGPDGRLYFTDPSEPYDPDNRSQTNRLYAIGSGDDEVLIALEPSYTNGLAFTIDDRLCWVESYWRTVCLLDDGERRVLATLPEDHVPDGLDVAQDGRLFITTVMSHGITVVAPDGEVLDHLYLDDDALPTNCCFDGSALWVTDFTAGHETQEGIGRLWRVETDAVGRAQRPGRV